MELTDILSRIYSRGLREKLTDILTSPRFSVNRAGLERISDRFVPFSEVESYSLPPPMGSEPVPPVIKNQNRRLTIPRPFVCELSETQLVGPNLVAISPDNRYVIEETAAKPEMLTDALAKTLYHGTLPIRRRNTRELDRPVASLAGIQSQAYFHWFADYLPRVRGIEKYAETTGVYPDVIVSSATPEWMAKSIQHIGVPEERLIRWKGGRVTAHKLIIPSVPRDADDPSHVSYSPRALRWVGDRIESAISRNSRDENRIFITRRGATTRRIVNEHEVIDVLSPLGFQPVNLTELPFEEQVALFAGAEAVIAPHGAGLINVIFSENINILEIFGDFVSPLYYCIAGGLDFSYRHERFEDTRPTGDSAGISIPGDDLIIDTDRLETTVEEWIENF